MASYISVVPFVFLLQLLLKKYSINANISCYAPPNVAYVSHATGITLSVIIIETGFIDTVHVILTALTVMSLVWCDSKCRITDVSHFVR